VGSSSVKGQTGSRSGFSWQVPSSRIGHSEKDRFTVARFFLSGCAPRLTDSIRLAERIHAALVELSDGSSVFTGCDGSGTPLKGYSHAFILSESNRALGKGQSGEITRITIYAPAGFGRVERVALENLWEIRGSGLQVGLVLQGWAGRRTSESRISCGEKARFWPRAGYGFPGRRSCPPAIPKSRGRAQPSVMRAGFRSAARSMSCGGF
jgi:hypothetical protein